MRLPAPLWADENIRHFSSDPCCAVVQPGHCLAVAQQASAGQTKCKITVCSRRRIPQRATESTFAPPPLFAQFSRFSSVQPRCPGNARTKTGQDRASKGPRKNKFVFYGAEALSEILLPLARRERRAYPASGSVRSEQRSQRAKGPAGKYEVIFVQPLIGQNQLGPEFAVY